jgi:hypothetical protein
LGETNHFVLAKREQPGEAPVDNSPFADDDSTVQWCDTYEMLECCGCENVTLRKIFWFSEWNDEQVTYYPPKISRRIPPWHDHLPDTMKSLFREVYSALGSDSGALVMMGAKALIDLAIVERVGDVGSFERKLEALQKAGFVSEFNLKILEAALEAGNAAAHRGHRPESKHIQQVMSIVENMVENMYMLEPFARQLKQSTPPRQKIGKSTVAPKQTPPNLGTSSTST